MKRYRIALGVALTTGLLLLPSANALAVAKPSVSLKAAAKSVTVGQSLKLTGTVTHPKSSAKSVTILKQVGKQWQHLATAKLSAKHTFAVEVTLTPAGTWHLMAQYKAGSTKVNSKSLTVIVKAWTAVSCGYAHTMALKSDGTLWAWGANSSGQLGLGSTKDRSAPTQVDPGSTWKAVSCGYDYTLALKKDGTLWAWGNNQHGQLGLGTPDDKAHSTPTQVDPGSTWKVVSCGYFDTLAIRSDGTLWAWGYNPDGELGLNDTTETNTPAQVGADSTWKTVSCGYEYTLAIKTDGSLWGCGDNMDGELGLGSQDSTSALMPVGAGSTWTAVSVSGTNWYTLAIKSDGTLWACGDNMSGELGLGGTKDSNALIQVGVGSTWTAVSCGYGFTLAVKTGGTLWAWGSSTSGNLGLGKMDSTNVLPTQVGADSTWTAVACGYEQTLAIKKDGTLWAWGDNFYGSLGLGNTKSKDIPSEVGSGS